MLSKPSVKLATLYCSTLLAKCKLTVWKWKTNELKRSHLSYPSRNKLDEQTAFECWELCKLSFFSLSHLQQKLKLQIPCKINFTSYSCLSVINFYLTNLKEHKNQWSKCKTINLYTVLECVSSDTSFLWHVSFASANEWVLAENDLKSQTVIEYLLCVPGIQEYKSDTFHITDGRMFYEMVVLRLGFKLLLLYTVCILRPWQKQEINFNRLN